MKNFFARVTYYLGNGHCFAICPHLHAAIGYCIHNILEKMGAAAVCQGGFNLVFVVVNAWRHALILVTDSDVDGDAGAYAVAAAACKKPDVLPVAHIASR